MNRVAHCPEDRRAHVVDQKARDSAEVDSQVYVLLEGDLGRGLEDLQDERDYQLPGYGENGAENQGDGHEGMGGPVDVLLVLGAVVVRDYDAGSAGEAHEEADCEIGDRGKRSDGGEGVLSDEVAHDPCVDRVVQLLEQASEKERQGKGNDLRKNRPRSHVHITALSQSK